MNCQLCGSRFSLTEVLDLGHQPICNALLPEGALNEPEIYYPLKLTICENCFLVQLADVLPAKAVFNSDYNYLSGTTQALVAHFKSLSKKIIEKFEVKRHQTVCDIGSNDGTFLKFFREEGIKVIGTEPTPLPAKIAMDSGIPTTQEFFTEETGGRLAKEIGRAKIVTAMNVLAHTDKVHSFLRGVRSLMTQESVFISQSHYLPSLIERLEYDTIYHEHLRYYTLTTLQKLLKIHGFHPFDVELSDVYGGSMIVYCSLGDVRPSDNLIRILDGESNYQRLETYMEFAKRARKNAKELAALLSDMRDEGKRIAGIGAPMKSSTLLNYCHVDRYMIDYLAEVNQLKIGKYSPGVHIPIVDESVLLSSPPDYALIFSWNVADDIIDRLRNKGYMGRFIIPIPEPRIIK